MLMIITTSATRRRPGSRGWPSHGVEGRADQLPVCASRTSSTPEPPEPPRMKPALSTCGRSARPAALAQRRAEGREFLVGGRTAAIVGLGLQRQVFAASLASEARRGQAGGRGRRRRRQRAAGEVEQFCVRCSFELLRRDCRVTGRCEQTAVVAGDGSRPIA